MEEVKGMDQDGSEPKSYISDELKELLPQLSIEQIQFVVARQIYITDKEAAKSCGLKPDTVYHWPPTVQQAVRLMSRDGVTTALHIRRRALCKAMLVKVGALDHPKPEIAQAAATEIIEWELGKATQTQKVEGTVTRKHEFTDGALGNVLDILGELGLLKPGAEDGANAKT